MHFHTGSMEGIPDNRGQILPNMLDPPPVVNDMPLSQKYVFHMAFILGLAILHYGKVPGAAQPKCGAACSKRIWCVMGGQNGKIVWNRADTKWG